jgi:RNA polymerase sigma factor (sigma-70 family)
VPNVTHTTHDLREQREAELLVVRCQLGEREAFDELIEAWHGPLWQYCRRVTGSDEAAGDIAQDIWLRVLKGITRLRDAGRLRAWLFGIARRVVMDRFREQYAAPIAADVDIGDVPADAFAGDVEEDLKDMRDGLARLPMVEREVLTLFYLQELSLAEVSDVLGIPLGTVKSRLFRARQLLRQELTNTEKKGMTS